VWALGRVVASTDDHGLKLWATGLAERVIPASEHLASPRAAAFATLGIVDWLRVYPGHRPARQLLDRFAAQLHELLREQRKPDWVWFEPVLAYDNARLPEALIRAGQHLGRDDMVKDGLAALEWLAEVQTDMRGHFRPVGTESFGRLYSRPLPFDQQPVDAWAMIEASIVAFEATGEDQWRQHAEAAFDWFNGRNDLGLRLSTPDGGCYDGLQVDRVNLNQGANRSSPSSSRSAPCDSCRSWRPQPGGAWRGGGGCGMTLQLLPQRLYPDASRVVVRNFQLGGEPRELTPASQARVRRIVETVQTMDNRTVQAELSLVMADFGNRHREVRSFFEQRYEGIADHLGLVEPLRDTERLLIGAYFATILL
jgi:hypothetical protein